MKYKILLSMLSMYKSKMNKQIKNKQWMTDTFVVCVLRLHLITHYKYIANTQSEMC